MKFQSNKLLLLQINDSLFPIGGYSHSFGLETYIQKDKIRTAGQAWDYVKSKTQNGFCYNELLSAKLAYAYAKSKDFHAIVQLEELLQASRIPKEVREAGLKLGSRFVKTIKQLDVSYELDSFQKYCEKKKDGSITYSVIYGVFCASVGIPYEESMEHYLYAQTSAMVTNCVKTIPLSQSDGQKLLYQSHEMIHKILETLDTLSIEDLCRSTPGFDIRCMQHEGLYSRIYMS